MLKMRMLDALPKLEPGVPHSESDANLLDYFASRKKIGELAGITTMAQVEALSELRSWCTSSIRMKYKHWPPNQ